MYKTTLLTISLFILAATQVSNAQIQLNDSAKVYLMTVSPWDGAVYAFFGHTGVYVQDDSTGVSSVFNYGYFDPTQPNFIYNFTRGKTDYVLGVNSYSDFLSEYRAKGLEVVKQQLNLSQEEKQKLWNALYINSLPENRRYRYNFLFDNCATRPRDIIENYVSGEKVVYEDDNKSQTFRGLIHECVNSYPWLKFGIDLVIGSDADKEITLREKMFLPEYLKNSFENALVVDTINHPLVNDTEIVLPAVNKMRIDSEQGVFTPIVISFALLLITIIVSIIQYIKWNKTKLPRIYDTILFSIFGAGGVIIFFLMFFSEHPATNPNWNFVWMNIFALIFAILFWVKSLKKVVNFYHFINFAVITLFLLAWWFIPQKMPLASIPLSMSLWIRSGMNVYMSSKRKMTNKRYVSSRYMKAGWGQ